MRHAVLARPPLGGVALVLLLLRSTSRPGGRTVSGMAAWRVALLSGCLACAALGLAPSVAVADRAFTPRSSTNTQGDIAVAANTVLSCVTDETGCPQARNPTPTTGATKLNNNDRVMSYVDDDGGGSSPTFNSSEAILTLPDGARVVAAWLYWGGRSAAGTGGKAAPDLGLRGTVKLQAPDEVGYSDVVSPFALDTAGDNEYQARANVTDRVRAAGAGVYRVANVQVGNGRNNAQSGGWALVVVFGHPDEPTRNLSLFDGFENVGSNSPGVTIPLSGFQTPLSGAVNATVGIVAQEGDRATLGDGATIRGAGNVDVRLGNAANPGGPPQSQANIFNASISRAGANVTDRDPGHVNNFGFDVDTFATTNVLGNNQTSTQVRLTTDGDAYIPGVVFIATELYAPQVAATKTVDTPTANLGEELTYTARFENTGADGAASFVVTDTIPDGTSYVPNSLAIDGVAQTDTSGDDRAEFDAAGDRVVARLGTGANATAGGTLAIGAASEVTFRVRIDDAGFAAGAEISNVTRASFTGETTDDVDYDPVDSAPAVTRLLLPDLVVQKTHSPGYVAGGSATIQIGVFNVGEGPTTGEIVLTDTLPAGMTVNGPITGPAACDVDGQTITCRYGLPVPPHAPTDPVPTILIPVAIAAGTPVGSLANTATLTNASDPNPDNNTVTDEGAVSEPQFDLSLVKDVTSSPVPGVPGYFPGAIVSYELRVTNNGTQPAPDVTLTDTLPDGLTLDPDNPPIPSQGTCTGSVCELGTIDPGEEVTVTVTALTGIGPDTYVSNATLVNRAEVTGAGTDVDPTNNSAEASIQTLPVADIVVIKEFSPEQPVAGGPVTYTVTVRNDGPDMVDIAVGDAIPPQILDPEITIAGDTGDCTPFEPIEGTDLRAATARSRSSRSAAHARSRSPAGSPPTARARRSSTSPAPSDCSSISTTPTTTTA